VAPSPHTIRCAAYVSQTAEITTKAIEGTYVATVRIDTFKIMRFAQPERAETVGLMYSPAADSEPVAPPTVTAQELTHSIIQPNQIVV